MSSWASFYYRDRYLKSEQWRTTRSEAMVLAKAVCQLCGYQSINNDAHYIFYPPNWEETRAQHLRILCRECHEKLHAYQERFGKANTLDDACIIFEIAKLEIANCCRTPMLRDATCFVCLADPASSYQVLSIGRPPDLGKCIALCDYCQTRFPELSRPTALRVGDFWDLAKDTRRKVLGDKVATLCKGKSVAELRQIKATLN